jgi:hypothetical protein
MEDWLEAEGTQANMGVQAVGQDEDGAQGLSAM